MIQALRFINSWYLNRLFSFRLLLFKSQGERWFELAKPKALLANELIAEREIRIRMVLKSWLREKLQISPFWKLGHLRFGEYSLADGDIASAYASCMALKILGVTADSSIEFSLLLGRCYLRSAEPERAREVFESGFKLDRQNLELCEELAAAYMALGRESEAVQVLSGFSNESLSQAAKAALAYLERGSKQ